MTSQIPSIKFSLRLAVASSRQFSAYEVGVLNDKSKAYEITRRAWPCCVMKYCSMQTHGCRLKLDAAGEHLSISEGCDLCCIPYTYCILQCNIKRATRTPITWL